MEATTGTAADGTGPRSSPYSAAPPCIGSSRLVSRPCAKRFLRRCPRFSSSSSCTTSGVDPPGRKTSAPFGRRGSSRRRPDLCDTWKAYIAFPTCLSIGRAIQALLELRYHGEAHNQGTPRTENGLGPAWTEIESRVGAKREVHHERREGRSSHRRHGRRRPVRPRCRWERLHRPRRWNRRPDGGPSAGLRNSGRERRTGPIDTHLLH